MFRLVLTTPYQYLLCRRPWGGATLVYDIPATSTPLTLRTIRQRSPGITRPVRNAPLRPNPNAPWLVHAMPAVTHLGCAAGKRPRSCQAAGELCFLPMFPALSDRGQGTVIKALPKLG